MGISLPGIYSGMDTSTIVSQLMAISQRPLTLLKNQKTFQSNKQSALDEIQKRVSSLKDLLDKLHDASALRSTAVSSSDTAILTVSAGSTADEGTHTVEVHQLASAQRRIQTAGLASATSSIGQTKSSALGQSVADADAAWFTAGAGGATYTFDFGTQTDLAGVTFAANTSYSMNQVRDLINARSQALAGYDAAEVVDQGGTFALKISAKENGAVGTMTQTLTAGDAIAQVGQDASWTKTNGLTGAFSYTYKGVTRTLQMPSGGTLTTLQDLINNDSANPGVRAGILNYSGSYHLVLSAKDTGSANTITVQDAATTLAGFDSADIVETQAAADAQIRVDGFPAADWIERSSNAIGDVIDGVTINLRKTGAVTVSANRSTDELQQDLTNLVSIYNGLVDGVGQVAGYDAKTKKGGVLQGDTSITGMMREIKNLLVTRPAGFVDGSEPYTLAGQIGLSFDKAGKLSLDSDKLSAALQDNYDGVLSLIGAMGSGASSSSYIEFSQAGSTTSAGNYDVEVDYDAGGAITTARIRKQGEVAWRFLDIRDGGTLMGQAGNPEAGLVLTSLNDLTPGAHTQTATVRVRQGLAGEMFDIASRAMDPVTGSLTLRENAIKDAINAIDKNIQTQQTRLDKIEKNLRDQFARLEATLAKMDVQNGAVTSMLQTFGTSTFGSSSQSGS